MRRVQNFCNGRPLGISRVLLGNFTPLLQGWTNFAPLVFQRYEILSVLRIFSYKYCLLIVVLFRKSLTQRWLNLSKAQSNNVMKPTTLVHKWTIPINTRFSVVKELNFKNFELTKSREDLCSLCQDILKSRVKYDLNIPKRSDTVQINVTKRIFQILSSLSGQRWKIYIIYNIWEKLILAKFSCPVTAVATDSLISTNSKSSKSRFFLIYNIF